MAAQVVNGNSTVSSCSPTSPLSCNFHSNGSATAAGNALFAFVTVFGSSVTLNTPSGWTLFSSAGNGLSNCYLYYLLNASALTSLSISWTGSPSQVHVQLIEASGVLSTDQQSSNTGTSTSPATSSLTPSKVLAEITSRAPAVVPPMMLLSAA